MSIITIEYIVVLGHWNVYPVTFVYFQEIWQNIARNFLHTAQIFFFEKHMVTEFGFVVAQIFFFEKHVVTGFRFATLKFIYLVFDIQKKV